MHQDMGLESVALVLNSGLAKLGVFDAPSVEVLGQ